MKQENPADVLDELLRDMAKKSGVELADNHEEIISNMRSYFDEETKLPIQYFSDEQIKYLEKNPVRLGELSKKLENNVWLIKVDEELNVCNVGDRIKFDAEGETRKGIIKRIDGIGTVQAICVIEEP